MIEVYISITATDYYCGSEVLEKGSTVFLKKDLENKYDREAIQVNLVPFGKVGYVANSVRTVIGDCMSAGRLYDKIGLTAEATVAYKTDHFIICKLLLDPSVSEIQNDHDQTI